MGWLNRLCIRQLKRAIPIAKERVAFARQYMDKTDIERRVANLAEIESGIRWREEVEQQPWWRQFWPQWR